MTISKDSTDISCDRIDPSKGYIKGNVHLVTNQSNLMRSDIDLKNINEWCRKLVSGKLENVKANEDSSHIKIIGNDSIIKVKSHNNKYIEIKMNDDI